MTLTTDRLIDWILCQRRVRVLAPLAHTRATFFYANAVVWAGTESTYRLRLADPGENGSDAVPVIEPIAFDPIEDSAGHLEVIDGKITACTTKTGRYVNEDRSLDSRFLSLSILHADLEISFRASSDYRGMIQIAVKRVEPS